MRTSRQLIAGVWQVIVGYNGFALKMCAYGEDKIS